MAGRQITWQNINAPNLGAELKAVDRAYEGMGESFDPLKDIIDRRQKQKDENFLIEEKNIFGAAAQLGTEAADESKDTSIGAKAVYDSIISQGRNADVAMQKATEWKEGAGILQDRYDKENLTTLDNLLLNTDPQRSPQAIQKTVEASGLNSKLKAQFKQSLTEEMNINRGEATYQEQQASKKAQDIFSAGVMKDIGNGIEPGAATKKWIKKSGLKGRQALELSNTARVHYEQQAQMTKDEQLQYAQTQKNANVKIQQYQKDLNTHIGTLKQQRNDLTGLSDNIMSIAEKSLGAPGGIVGEIMSNLTDTGMEPTDWYSSLKTSPARVARILNDKYTQFKKIPGVNDAEAAGLLWLAYQDSIGDSYGWGGAKGVNPKSIDATTTDRLKQYDKGEILKKQIIKDSTDGEKELTDIILAKDNFLMNTIKKTRKGNLTGKETSMVDFGTGQSKVLAKQATKDAKIKLKAEIEENARLKHIAGEDKAKISEVDLQKIYEKEAKSINTSGRYR